MNPLDLVIVGNTSIDTITLDGNPPQKVPGGSAAAVATGAAAAGLSTGLFSRVGKNYSPAWKEQLKQHGVDLRGLLSQPSSTRFELRYNTRYKLTYFAEIFNGWSNLKYAQFPAAYRTARHVHLAAGHPMEQVEFLSNLRGPTISLTLWPAYQSDYNETFLKHLKRVKILFCNNYEARMIAGKENIYDAAKEIAKHGPNLVALTKGAKGSTVYDGKEFFLFPALRSSKQDTTGCGDSFAAGFLAEYLRSADVEKAGWLGTSLASFSMSKVGAWFPPEITQEQIEHRVERAKKYSERRVKKGTLLDYF